MSVTILAILFLILLLAIAAFGFKAIIKQGKAPEDIHKERCSICRNHVHASQLIERQIGDYRVLYFCRPCITTLMQDASSKN
jgi:predicted SprT family Zn-dependent metalloprotease